MGYSNLIQHKVILFVAPPVCLGEMSHSLDDWINCHKCLHRPCHLAIHSGPHRAFLKQVTLTHKHTLTHTHTPWDNGNDECHNTNCKLHAAKPLCTVNMMNGIERQDTLTVDIASVILLWTSHPSATVCWIGYILHHSLCETETSGHKLCMCRTKCSKSLKSALLLAELILGNFSKVSILSSQDATFVMSNPNQCVSSFPFQVHAGASKIFDA